MDKKSQLISILKNAGLAFVLSLIASYLDDRVFGDKPLDWSKVLLFALVFMLVMLIIDRRSMKK